MSVYVLLLLRHLRYRKLRFLLRTYFRILLQTGLSPHCHRILIRRLCSHFPMLSPSRILLPFPALLKCWLPSFSGDNCIRRNVKDLARNFDIHLFRTDYNVVVQTAQNIGSCHTSCNFSVFHFLKFIREFVLLIVCSLQVSA